MRQKSGPEKRLPDDAIMDIQRATRRNFSSEEKIRVLSDKKPAGRPTVVASVHEQPVPIFQQLA